MNLSLKWRNTMALTIDETNKEALKAALGVNALEARVKALEDSASTQASSASSGSSESGT
jgi:hypothetical protein